LLQAIKDYDTNKWKVIGQKVGKPAKVSMVISFIFRVFVRFSASCNTLRDVYFVLSSYGPELGDLQPKTFGTPTSADFSPTSYMPTRPGEFPDHYSKIRNLSIRATSSLAIHHHPTLLTP
jgi:hypothetical protein